MLKRAIRHTVLNAKFHEREAEIVAQAGQSGAVTIATNMAGRGTDINWEKASRNWADFWFWVRKGMSPAELTASCARKMRPAGRSRSVEILCLAGG